MIGRFLTGFVRRLLAAFVMFLLFMALAALVPRSLPGELASGDMTAHGPVVCASCAPHARLAGIGLLAGRDRWFVNVRFAGTPLNEPVVITLAGVPGTLSLQKTETGWRTTATGGVLKNILAAAERDNLVVFSLPGTLRATGVAVSTASGDRIPDSGFAPPVYPPPPHFNLTDMVLLLILAVTAVAGFRRGAEAEVASLVAVLVSLALAVLLFRPVASALAAMTGTSEGAAILGGGIVVVLCALAGYFVMPRLLPHITPSLEGFPPAATGGLGAVLACVRQVPLLALMLGIGVQIAILHWASSSITSSLLGGAMLRITGALFTAG